MRSVSIALFLLAACDPTCPIDPADSGCTMTPECSEAAEGRACVEEGQSCTLCEASYHSYVARCEPADAGLAWAVYRGTPPPGCP